jgi:hypothetical protein
MGHRRRTDERLTFADVAEEVRASAAAGGEPTESCSPIRDRRFTDENGTVWRMRGGELRWSRLERLIGDPAVRVLHVCRDDQGAGER